MSFKTVSTFTVFTVVCFAALCGCKDIISSVHKEAVRHDGKMEQVISMMDTALNIDFLAQKLGPPVHKYIFGHRTFDGQMLRYQQYVFNSKECWLNVYVDEMENIVAFFLIAKEPDSRLSVKSLSFDRTFTSLGTDYDKFIFCGVSSKEFQYIEEKYKGNAGDYQYLYSGYISGSGILYDTGCPEKLIPVSCSRKAVEKFRQQCKPNVIGVSDIELCGDEGSIGCLEIDPGLDFITRRKLWHIY
jgi:hypothetical protein